MIMGDLINVYVDNPIMMKILIDYIVKHDI